MDEEMPKMAERHLRLLYKIKAEARLPPK